ncbi:unnamed protein product [Caenorhabditis angaria]|uniref:Uncharacterized protein n=1 Tax=Caenorhabditis angaria TaxID=860376 RepID=A0A9P1MY05_9PELO|nr:unnamed protein product [Caenorhabditis angaria]
MHHVAAAVVNTTIENGSVTKKRKSDRAAEEPIKPKKPPKKHKKHHHHHSKKRKTSSNDLQPSPDFPVSTVEFLRKNSPQKPRRRRPSRRPHSKKIAAATNSLQRTAIEGRTSTCRTAIPKTMSNNAKMVRFISTRTADETQSMAVVENNGVDDDWNKNPPVRRKSETVIEDSESIRIPPKK